MSSLNIKKGDTVKILAGKDKGKTGKVIRSFPKKNRIIVEGINVFKKHQKSKKGNQGGQIIEKALPIHASNVILSGTKTKAKKK